MALNACLVLAIVLLATLLNAHAGDPDIVSDFVVPDGVTANAEFFTSRAFRTSLWGEPKGVPFKVTKASQAEFAALNGQSVSLATLQYASGGVNPPHTHPRAAELLLVVSGSLEVGLVDSTNKLYTKMLYTGDLFVFPKGLVHYQVNRDTKYPAVAVSAFGSANAGTVSLPKNLFGSSIDKGLLAKFFKTDSTTIDNLVFGATMDD